MLKFIKSASLAIGLLGLVSGSAGAVSFTVDSAANSTGGGVGFGTGIFLTAGQGFTVTADLADTWSLGSNSPATRESNANGLTSYYGNYSQGGLTALFGSLVGQIGSGNFFFLGSNFSGLASATGQLFLYNFDSNQSDNSGFIEVQVSAVPLPPGLVLAGSALLMLGAMGMKRKRAAV